MNWFKCKHSAVIGLSSDWEQKEITIVPDWSYAKRYHAIVRTHVCERCRCVYVEQKLIDPAVYGVLVPKGGPERE